MPPRKVERWKQLGEGPSVEAGLASMSVEEANRARVLVVESELSEAGVALARSRCLLR
jgi:hypothetical protein